MTRERASTDELLTPAQRADEMHTTETGLAQQRFRGTGPRFVKRGARVLYRRSDVDAYLDAQTRERTGVTHAKKPADQPRVVMRTNRTRKAAAK
jgi:hypothetical protein